MNTTAHSTTNRSRPTRENRELPAKEHYPARPGTVRHRPERAHNPEVGGSNPPPATKKPQVRALLWLGVVCSGPDLCQIFYRNLTLDTFNRDWVLRTSAVGRRPAQSGFPVALIPPRWRCSCGDAPPSGYLAASAYAAVAEIGRAIAAPEFSRLMRTVLSSPVGTVRAGHTDHSIG